MRCETARRVRARRIGKPCSPRSRWRSTHRNHRTRARHARSPSPLQSTSILSFFFLHAHARPNTLPNSAVASPASLSTPPLAAPEPSSSVDSADNSFANAAHTAQLATKTHTVSARSEYPSLVARPDRDVPDADASVSSVAPRSRSDSRAVEDIVRRRRASARRVARGRVARAFAFPFETQHYSTPATATTTTTKTTTTTRLVRLREIAERHERLRGRRGAAERTLGFFTRPSGDASPTEDVAARRRGGRAPRRETERALCVDER